MPEGRFNEEILRLFGDGAGVAAHDAGDAFRTIAVADDAEIRIEVNGLAVEKRHLFAFAGPADRNLPAFELVHVEEMGRTAELEHDVVRNVDEGGDMALTGAFETIAHPLRRFGLGVEAADHAAGEAAAEIGRFNADRQPAFARRRHLVHGGQRERSTGHGMKVAGHARHGERIAAVRRELHFDAGIVKLRVLADRHTDRRVGRQNPDAAVIFARAEFAGRAEHAHRDHAAELGLLDLEAAREFGADQRARHLDAGLHVGRAADDLEDFARSGVDFADVQMIGVFMIAAGEHFGNHDARESRRDRGHFLNFETRHGERFGKIVGIELRIDVLTQPLFCKQHVSYSLLGSSRIS